MNAKAIERVEKLLRLAAPTSGSTEHERSAAALEAAKLIAEHNLVVREREAPPPRVRRERKPAPAPGFGITRPAPAPRPSFIGSWAESTAAREAFCSDPTCGEEIHIGDPVWMRAMPGYGIEYIHRNGACGW